MSNEDEILDHIIPIIPRVDTGTAGGNIDFEIINCYPGKTLSFFSLSLSFSLS